MEQTQRGKTEEVFLETIRQIEENVLRLKEKLS